VNANASGFDEHSFINRHTVYNENRGVLANKNVLGKPTVVVMLCIVLNKTVNAKTFAKVGKFRVTAAVIALTAKKNRGNNLIANLDRIALGVNGNALTDSYNFARSLVTENDFLIAEGVVTVFVNIGAANAAALNLNEYFAGTGGRDFDVAKFYDSLALNAVNNFGFYKISYF
jgi:hypothetical protein